MPGNNRNSPTSPRNVKIRAEERAQMAQMRAGGATFREIGQAFGRDPTTVRNHVMRMLDEVTYEGATAMRTLEGERLDRMQRALWPQATAGDKGSIDRVLKIMDQRARLFGLYAPVQIDATIGALDADARATVEARVALVQERRMAAIEVTATDDTAQRSA